MFACRVIDHAVGGRAAPAPATGVGAVRRSDPRRAAAPGVGHEVVRRVHDDLAGRPVDDDGDAGLDRRCSTSPSPTTAGHVQRAREDGGVVRAAPGVAREPLDLPPVHLRGHRRRQLVGDRGPTRPRRRGTGRRRGRAPAPGSSAGGRRRRRRRPGAPAGRRPRCRRRCPTRSSNARCTAHSALTCCSWTMSRGAGDEHRVVDHEQLGVEQVAQLGRRAVSHARLDGRAAGGGIAPGPPRGARLRRPPGPAPIGNRITSGFCISSTARPTTTPGDTPMPVRRCTAPHRIPIRRAGRALRARPPRRRPRPRW